MIPVIDVTVTIARIEITAYSATTRNFFVSFFRSMKNKAGIEADNKTANCVP